jgi:sugar porter (SP) family MFS transporter
LKNLDNNGRLLKMVRRHSTIYNKLLNVFVALGSITYGYCNAIIGFTIGQPGWYEFLSLVATPGEPGYSHTTHVIATVNGLFSAGGAVGSLAVMFGGDRVGRKMVIVIGAGFSVLGGALQSGADSLGMFYAGRFITGVGIGILVVIVPMYLSEASAPEVRGWQVGAHAMLLVFGYTSAGWIGYACFWATPHNPSFAWRFPLAVQVLFPLLLLLGTPFVPESPRWLLAKGGEENMKTAWRTLQRLHGSGDEFVKDEFLQMSLQIQLEQTRRKEVGGHLLKAAFARKSYRWRMFVGFMTQFGAEVAGPLIINNYQVLLYANLGEKPSTGMPLLLAAVWLTTACIIYNPLGSYLHDKVNSRRKMYMTGIAGCLGTTSVLAALTATYANTSNKVGNGFAILFLYLYLAFQGTFCDTTMYLYVSEIFPFELRTIGMGFSLFGQFAATLIVLQTAPIGFANVGWKFYLLIICWCVFYLPIIYFCFPETAQLTLEEIGERFGDDIAWKITDPNANSEEQKRVLYEFLETHKLNFDNPPESQPPITDIKAKEEISEIETKP